MTVSFLEQEDTQETPVQTYADLKPDKDGAVTTPRCPETKFNFGPASDRDNIVYTCERPGGDQGDAMIGIQSVEEWMNYMKDHQIHHVLVLLDDNELEKYQEPGLLQLYRQGGLSYFRAPMGKEGASQRVINFLKEKEIKGEKVVCHCTHGMGRSGRVAAGWIAARYGLLPQESTEEAINTAILHKIHRLGNTQLLENWLGPALASPSP